MPQITDEDAGRQAVCQMLDLLAWSEGTSTSPVTKADGYDVIVTGVDGPEVFTDYANQFTVPMQMPGSATVNATGTQKVSGGATIQ
jgi:hypothetical protein